MAKALACLTAIVAVCATISSADPSSCAPFAPAGSSALDVEAAYEYACLYADSPNPGFHTYANDAGNFASQLLLAGGALPSQGRPSDPIAWWTRGPDGGSAPPQHTDSWASVPDLYEYLIDSGIAIELPASAATLADTQAGDLIFWDWAAVGATFDDVSMVVSGDGTEPSTELVVSHASEGAGAGWSPIGGMHTMEDLLDDRVGAFLHSLTDFNATKYGSSGSCPSSDPGSGGISGQCWRWRVVRLLSTTRDGHAGPTQPRETRGGWNPSEAPCQPCGGDPVNTATGEFTEQLTDLTLSGRGPVVSLRRTYGAFAAASAGRFGHGWTDAYEMSVYPDPVLPDTMDIEQENGAITRFTQQPDGSWEAPSRVFATLRENPGGSWTFTRMNADVFEFDASGRLVAQSDRNGYTATLSYDGSGKLTTVTNDAGLSLSYTYTGSRVTQVRATGGRTVGYAYDGTGNLVTVTDVVGEDWSYGYDADHRLTTMTAPEGGSVTNTYDGDDRVIEQEDALGHVTRWSYALDETVSGSSTVTTPEGVVTLEQYVAGNIVAETLAHGTSQAATTRYAYDPVTNQQMVVTDPLGRSTISAFDERGNLLRRTDPRGFTETRTYNRYGQVTSVTLPATYGGRSVTTSYSYDEPAYSSGGAGNLTTVSTPVLDAAGVLQDTQVTHFAHADASNPSDVTSMVDPLGARWTYTYDGLGNKTSERAPETDDNSDGSGARQNVTRWAYDAATGLETASMSGRYMLAHPSATTCSPPATGCTVTSYDDAGRVRQVVDPSGEIHRWHYDGNGNVDYEIDADGERTEYVFDRADQHIATVADDGTTERTTYTPDGLVSHRIDGARNDTQYAYDLRGSVVAVTDPNSRTTRYGHDLADQLVFKADPGMSCTVSSTSTGCTIYTRDANGNMTGVDYNDADTPDVTWEYDAVGRRTRMTDGTGSSTWSYDSLGRTTQAVNGNGATLAYEYDVRGGLTAIDYPGATAGTVTRSYDPAGRIDAIDDWVGNTTSFRYDADGNLTTTSHPATGLPVVDTIAYDAVGEISGSTVVHGSTTHAQLDYERDAEGALTEVDATGVPSGDDSYAYDSLDRLTTAGGSSYGYDAANRVTRLTDGTVQTYDPAGQLRTSTLGGSTATFRYDTRGQRVEGGTPGASPSTYAYDQAGRLDEVTPASPAPVYTYEYDGDGLRTSKTASGNTEEFAWEAVANAYPVMALDAAAAYVYGPDGAALQRIDSSGDVLWYHHDQQGSTRLLTTRSGTVAGTATYNPYGRTVATTGTTTPLGYSGEYTDAETGFIFLRARYYDPATAQFITRDPAEVVTGEPYAYVSANPLNLSDPSGLCPLASISRKRPVRCGPRGTPYGSGPCLGPQRPPNNDELLDAILQYLKYFNMPEPANGTRFNIERARNGEGYLVKPPDAPPGTGVAERANSIRAMFPSSANKGQGSLSYYDRYGNPVNYRTGGVPKTREDWHVPGGNTSELKGLPEWWTGG